jgi:O-acetyl-ADP-ribose deacetylase (regulator of RNase III)
MIVTARRGDITRVPADAIVNAANTRMRGGAGVDGAIHAAGGPAILADCIARYPHGLPVGSAGHTVAGDLPARWVIHVVGPNYGAGERDSSLLTGCYRSALQVAEDLGCATVTFPAVSTGIFRWPLADAARLAVGSVAAYVSSTGDEGTIRQACFVLFDDRTMAAFQEALDALPGS